MDFDDFSAVHRAYVEQRDVDYRDKWERMRLLATIVIQPHLAKNKHITPDKLLPLPWDMKAKIKTKGAVLTPDQQRKRMEQLVERLGDKL